MSSAFNPTTSPVQYRPSVNSPDFPAPWVLNQPEADALYAANVPVRYWKSVGGIATEMDAGEKAIIDTNSVNASRDATAARMDDIEDVVRALALATLDELNTHALKTNEILDAVDAATSLADLKTRIAAVTDYPQRTGAQLKTSVRNKLGT